MKKLALMIVAMLFTFHAHAEGLDTRKIFFGGGLSVNDADHGDNATGFQVFAGLPVMAKLGKADLSAELGYMDSGNFGGSAGRAQGVWLDAVVDVPVGQNISLLARAGLDFGDDDGFMFGGGVAVPVTGKVDLRFEYVVRDHIDSLQANIVIRQ
jgi:hypothetical protein